MRSTGFRAGGELSSDLFRTSEQDKSPPKYLTFFVVFVAPGGHAAEDRDEVVTFVCHGVFGAGRDLSKCLFSDDAMLLKCLEALREGTRVDTADRFFEFAEALWAATKVTDNEGSPFLSDDTQGRGDAANLWFYGGDN